MDRFYQMAWRRSLTSRYLIDSKRMAALVVRGGKVLSCATNLTGSKQGDDGKHAECRALRPNNDYTGATIYIARSNGLVSRPCHKCMPLLLAAGIKRAVYINTHGNLVLEKL